MRQQSIDINCDLGESYGAYKIGADEEILHYITSANIACGFHAGDYNVMNRTVQQAKHLNLSIGAHPGLPDLHGFGRRIMDVSTEEVYNMTLYQLGALHAFCVTNNTELGHVKPHGALYNMAANNLNIATAIAKAVYDFDSSLTLFGLSGSELIKAGKSIGLRTAAEVFADRTYQPDGSLTPRTNNNAIHTSLKDAIDQALLLIKEGKVIAVTGDLLSLEVDTICIHGDHPDSLMFVKELRNQLQREDILLKGTNVL